MSRLIIIIGVSGSGKTTLGQALAAETTLPFIDADDFHPPENIAKMSKGEPLNDADRAPWLEILNKTLLAYHKKGGAVLACSALKESYRVKLSYKLAIQWVYLDGSYDQIYERMQAREHFMPADLLKSQFDALEAPSYGIQLNAKDSVQDWVKNVQDGLSKATHFGIVGLGVMGKSLALNALSKGIPLAVFNRQTTAEAHIIPDFIKEVNTNLCKGYTNLKDFVSGLEAPRKILLMVPAGIAVDMVIDEITPLLTADDIIIDAGNSHFRDTQSRFLQLSPQSLHYIGLGVSGGQEGALIGPAFMPGGDKAVIDSLSELTAMAAKFEGKACNLYMGSDGAGHFIKMIHNGIEYAEMQLLAEVYDLLLSSSYSTLEIAAILEAWQVTDLQSYLLGIMPDILRKEENGVPLVALIEDAAQGKGTGVWSVKNSLAFGEPTTMMSAAVNARFSSALRDKRIKMAELYSKEKAVISIDLDILFEAYKNARIINHIQGFTLIRAVALEQNWDTSLSAVAHNWSAGCILKSKLIREFEAAFRESNSIEDVSVVKELFFNDWSALQETNIFAIHAQLPIPCFSAALTHILTFTQGQSSANIIQAQRDYFGAHGYKRKDSDDDTLHNTNWTS